MRKVSAKNRAMHEEFCIRICGGGGGGGGYGHHGSSRSINYYAGYYARNIEDNYKKRILEDLTKEEISELETAIDVFRPISSAFVAILVESVEDVSPRELLEYFKPIMGVVQDISNLNFDSSSSDKKQFVELVAVLNSARKSNEEFCNLFDLESSDFRRGITEYLDCKCEVDFYDYLHECETWI